MQKLFTVLNVVLFGWLLLLAYRAVSPAMQDSVYEEHTVIFTSPPSPLPALQPKVAGQPAQGEGNAAGTEPRNPEVLAAQKARLQEVESSIYKIRMKQQGQSRYLSLFRYVEPADPKLRAGLEKLLGDRSAIINDFAGAAAKNGTPHAEYADTLAEALQETDTRILANVSKDDRQMVADSLRLGQHFHFANALDARLRNAGCPVSKEQFAQIVHIMSSNQQDRSISPLSYPVVIDSVSSSLTAKQRQKFLRFAEQQQAMEAAGERAANLR